MTTTPQDYALEPCPFCGSKAHFEIDDQRWEWIECESCAMQGNRSASLMEDCKPKLVEAWNRRAPQSDWLPIAEAPTDTEILVGPTKRMGICVAMNDSRDGWVTETPSEWVSIYTPTVFQYLPLPPSTKGESTNGPAKDLEQT